MNKKFVISTFILIAAVLYFFVYSEYKRQKMNTLVHYQKSAEKIDMPGLPPDPSEAGKATVEGVDSDHDGVRDDIQRYIALNFLDSEKQRAALFQEAKALQAVLKAGVTKVPKDIKSAHEASQKSSDCLRYVIPGYEREGVYRSLESQMVNTRIRSDAYLAYDAAYSDVFGYTTEIPKDLGKQNCDGFDPDTVKN